MKTLKRNFFVKSLLLLLVVAFLGSCKKDGDDGSNDIGKGSFTIKGTTHSGPCVSIAATSGVSGNIDVVIADESGASFTVYNMPTGGSGTSNVVEFTDSNGFSSELYALSVSGSTLYSSTGGTITKTGSNSYKFSINMIDLSTDEQITITGSGKY
ncbi:hypothetical protein [Mucilaginibacter sp.]|uniref:hypothetical protein n=1 Tax=Mucilaginibacter sp. TaxID=1882438 RepID=UPI00261D75F3|nr:hypothetical protein [Mucilaginibacter sp.]MDB5125985.1 hypothetical protein [Mucilaginibacter sp.]